MWTRSSICLIGAALCVGTVLAPRPAQAMYGDIQIVAVDEPGNLQAPAGSPQIKAAGVWAPTEAFVATWESVTGMAKLSNPTTPGAGAIPERSLSLAARVDVLDVNGLLGFDSAAQGTLVLDGKPAVIYSKAIPSRFCHFYRSLRYTRTMSGGQWVSQLQPYNFTVSIPFDPNRPYPALLSRVEWSMYALLSTEIKTVDVPFSPSADWVTLAPGVEIKVEQATATGGQYQYRFATRYDHNKVEWAPIGSVITLWTFDPTPELIISKMDILDAQGKSVRDPLGSSSSSSGSATGSASSSSGGAATSSASSSRGGVATSSSSSDSPVVSTSAVEEPGVPAAGDLITAAAEGSGALTTGTTSGGGSCSSCGAATTFRFTLAFHPRQQQLRFILENVPVPTF